MASRKGSALSTRSAIRAKSEANSSGYLSDNDIKDPYSEDFDPASFKVVELRALLHEHDVSFPSTIRKAGLIQAYEDNIRPNLDELRAARNRDRNIRPKVEDVNDISVDSNFSVPSIKVDGELEASGNESESSLHSAILNADSSRRGRRSVSWAEDISGPEDEVEESEEQQVGNSSTFSINNPFQSPRLEPIKKVAARKSEPASTHKSPTKQPRSSAAPSLFRNYMDPAISSGTSPRQITKTTNSPKDRLKAGMGTKKEEEVGLDSGFDGDVSRDGLETPSKSPRQQQRKKGGSKLSRENDDWTGDENVQTARSVVWLLIAISSITWWCWYVSESQSVGFCDVGRSSNALLDKRMLEYEQTRQAIEGGDESANVTLGVPLFLRPSCTPCPAHAICQSGFLSGCESGDYVLQKSLTSQLPFSDFLLPLSKKAPICRPDEQKALHAADLADEIENRLRIRKGDIQCRRKVARTGGISKKVSRIDTDNLAFSMSKDDLHDALQVEVSKSDILVSQPEEYYEELWSLALKDLIQTDRVGEVDQERLLLYAKRGAIGVDFQCWARLVMEDIWHRMRIWVALLSALVISAQWLRIKLQGNRSRQDKAKVLIASTLSRLEQAKRFSLEDDESYLSISQLRDDILRLENSEKAKKLLWSSVVKEVEANSNVRTRQAKVKGEWSRVWEWVGSLEGRKVSRVISGRQSKENGHTIVNEGKGRLESAEI